MLYCQGDLLAIFYAAIAICVVYCVDNSVCNRYEYWKIYILWHIKLETKHQL